MSFSNEDKTIFWWISTENLVSSKMIDIICIHLLIKCFNKWIKVLVQEIFNSLTTATFIKWIETYQNLLWCICQTLSLLSIHKYEKTRISFNKVNRFLINLFRNNDLSQYSASNLHHFSVSKIVLQKYKVLSVHY